MLELDRLCGSYLDLLWHLDPAAASAAGSVSGDGRLGRFDAQAVREHVAAFRATAAAIEELEIEPLEDEIDRTALLDDVRATIAGLEEDRTETRDPGLWVSHLRVAVGALLLRPDGDGPAGRLAHDVAERIAAIPGFLDSAHRTLRRPPALLVDGALAALGPAGELLVAAAARFGAEAPGGADALNLAVAAALKALAQFGHRLREEVEPAPGLGGAVLGVTRYERRLGLRYAVRAGAAELWRHATRLIDETETGLAREAQDLAGGRSWRELVTELVDGNPASAARIGGRIEAARARLRDLGFPLADVAGPDVLPAPAVAVGILPGVTYLAATGRLLLAPPLPGEAAVDVIVAAEALPGRHLQERAARDLGSEVRRRLRTAIGVDGWALYAEELVDELALLPREARLIRLARLLRAAGRLAVDVGLHARDMSVPDAVTLLVDRAGLAPREAEAELRRIVARPTDAAAAAAGRREILALRTAAGVRTDDLAALGRFHAALLGYGALPPGLAGWGMGVPR